jgi:DNA-directed RNA polymerase sigma subunit (sigma70/sigma32)
MYIFNIDVKGKKKEVVALGHSTNRAIGVIQYLLYKNLRLSEKERYVLIERLNDKTLREISDDLGFAPAGERIRQIEAKACRKLRHPLNWGGNKNYAIK